MADVASKIVCDQHNPPDAIPYIIAIDSSASMVCEVCGEQADYVAFVALPEAEVAPASVQDKLDRQRHGKDGEHRLSAR